LQRALLFVGLLATVNAQAKRAAGAAAGIAALDDRSITRSRVSAHRRSSRPVLHFAAAAERNEASGTRSISPELFAKAQVRFQRPPAPVRVARLALCESPRL